MYQNEIRVETERVPANMPFVPVKESEIVFVKFKFLFLILLLIVAPFVAFAQQQDKPEKDGIYVVVEDIQGGKLEGYLRFSPEELLVSTKDNQEKSVCPG
jgi:hypothetical protein